MKNNDPMIVKDEPQVKIKRRKPSMFDKVNHMLGHDNEEEHSYFLFMDEVHYDSARELIQWILACNFSEKSFDMLNVIICSPGGDLRAAFAVVDIMKGSKIPIRTVGIGEIASAGLLMFMAGKKGERIITPNTGILSHQYNWGNMGKQHELIASNKEIDLTTQRYIDHYKKCTKLKTEKDIRQYLLPPSDMWLSAEEAVKYGIADIIKELN